VQTSASVTLSDYPNTKAGKWNAFRLEAHLKQPLLVIWDGLKAHRSRLVHEYLDSLEGHIQIAFLPPYAGHEPGRIPVGFAEAPRAVQMERTRRENLKDSAYKTIVAKRTI